MMLKQLRLRAKVSQNQLARAGGCDPGYVNRLENERTAESRTTHHAPGRVVVLRLAAALGCSLVETDELLCAAGLVPLSIARMDAERRHALLLVLDGTSTHHPLVLD
jgi:transcriptional regulator with XRE-family HTH domain